MWIVRLALRRPYTFVVVALLIVALGIVTVERMSTDIFPNVDIPVVTVIWSFTGISPDDMVIALYEAPGENFSFGQGEAQRVKAVATA